MNSGARILTNEVISWQLVLLPFQAQIFFAGAFSTVVQTTSFVSLHICSWPCVPAARRAVLKLFGWSKIQIICTSRLGLVNFQIADFTIGSFCDYAVARLQTMIYLATCYCEAQAAHSHAFFYFMSSRSLRWDFTRPKHLLVTLGV